jgi:hypothetical protein
VQILTILPGTLNAREALLDLECVVMRGYFSLNETATQNSEFAERGGTSGS